MSPSTTATTRASPRSSSGASNSHDKCEEAPAVRRLLRGQPVPPHLRYLEGSFRNARGQALFFLGLSPRRRRGAPPLRAAVLFLHAIGDHSRRYAYLFEHLCDRGFAVVAYDLVGHGASDADDAQATRVHATRFRHFVDDTRAFAAFARRELLPALLSPTASEHESPSERECERECERERESAPPVLPLVLSGLSFGALVAMHTAIEAAEDGDGELAFAALCLAGPSINVAMTPVLSLQAAVARPLALLLPRARLVPGVNREWLCRDPGFFEDFDNDPLTHTGLLTMRMGEQTLRAMRRLRRRSERAPGLALALPVLFLVGSEDRVTSVPHTLAFFDRLQVKDKELKLFDGLYHCVFEDPERDDVLRYMTDWLCARFAPRDIERDSEGGGGGDDRGASSIYT